MTYEDEMMTTRETAEGEQHGSQKLVILIIVGFIVMFVGLVLVAIAAVLSQGGSTSTGGIIFIGPVPIVFGTGPGAQWLILVAIILAALTIIMLLMLGRKRGV